MAKTDGATKQEVKNLSDPVDGSTRISMVQGEDNLLDIREYIRTLTKFWWLIAICIGVGGYLGIRDLHAFKPQSIAKMIVLPVGGGGGGDSGEKSGGGGILASISSLALGGSSGPGNFDLLLYEMSSLQLARILQEKYGLMQKVYSGSWSEETKQWIVPKNDSSEYIKSFDRYLNVPVWTPPTIENLAEFVKGKLKVEQIRSSAYQEIRFVDHDPEFALWMLNTVFKEALGMVRDRQRNQQKIRRELIQRRLSETPISEFKSALVEMLAREIRSELLISDKLPFAAEVIEIPFISTEKTTPDRNRLVYLKMVIGGAFAGLIVLVWMLYRRE